MTEYRVMACDLDPAAVQGMLSALAAEGWRLKEAFPVPAKVSMIGPPQLALYCILERDDMTERAVDGLLDRIREAT
jgi:hypothetical protein